MSKAQQLTEAELSAAFKEALDYWTPDRIIHSVPFDTLLSHPADPKDTTIKAAHNGSDVSHSPTTSSKDTPAPLSLKKDISNGYNCDQRSGHPRASKVNTPPSSKVAVTIDVHQVRLAYHSKGGGAMPREISSNVC